MFLESYRPANRLAIVRNPWARLVSAYEDKVIRAKWPLNVSIYLGVTILSKVGLVTRLLFMCTGCFEIILSPVIVKLAKPFYETCSHYTNTVEMYKSYNSWPCCCMI